MKWIGKNLDKIFLLIFSLLGLYASFELSVGKFKVLKNPEISLSCSINQAINCKSVMSSNASELFGFPNQFLGLIGYSLVFCFSFLSFFYPVLKNKILGSLLAVGNFSAFIFSYWLIYQSIFNIKALCPLCLLSCFSATNLFFLSFYNLIKNEFELKFKKLIYSCLVYLWYVLWLGIIYINFAEEIFK